MALAFCGLGQACIAQICFSFMWFSQIARVGFFSLIECGRTEGQHLFLFGFSTQILDRVGKKKKLLENFDVYLYRTKKPSSE